MSGTNIFVDTNILIYYLNRDRSLLELLSEKLIHISFISELELLSFKHFSKNEKNNVEGILKECLIYGINDGVKQLAVDIRLQYRLKLPDAIVAASSKYYNLPLFTADKEYSKVKNLELVIYQP